MTDLQTLETAEALEIGTHLSEAAASGSKLAQSDQLAAERVLSIPIVAQVILRLNTLPSSLDLSVYRH